LALVWFRDWVEARALGEHDRAELALARLRTLAARSDGERWRWEPTE
jgi:hypothetical protein